MREFFRGWRRKVGCVTLVMACVLTSSWIRSNVAQELVWFRWQGIAHKLRHENGLLMSQWDYMSDDEPIIEFASYEFTHTFHGHADAGDWRISADVIYIPHWALVMPLTIVSACLLLRRPGQRVVTESEGGTRA